MARMVKLGVIVVAVAVVALAASARAEDKAKSKASQLELVKRLAGEWTGKGQHGEHEMDATVTYRVTSGGTAVMETLDPGGEHEMVTVYHQDGDDLVLTHYCMLGNQPRMKAEKSDGSKKLVFKFAGAGNLKSEKDPHMHDLTLEFLGDDHIKTTWTFYQDGKPSGKAVFDLKRKKK
jgi:hypothetical protein